MTDENAQEWLDAGAGKVIVTSWLFPDGVFSLPRLQKLSGQIGKDRLVVDLSCRRVRDTWFVAMNKWQTITTTEVTQETLLLIAEYCCEFLIHAADVEGLCQGIDHELVTGLALPDPSENQTSKSNLLCSAREVDPDPLHLCRWGQGHL